MDDELITQTQIGGGAASDDLSGEVGQDAAEQLPTQPVAFDVVGDGWELEGVEVYALPPITESTGLKGVLYDVIGPYDTIVTQYTYRANGNSYLTYVNDVSPDYPWMISAGLFVVLVYCVFRMLGGLLAWRK